jgi:hypothetical protein
MKFGSGQAALTEAGGTRESKSANTFYNCKKRLGCHIWIVEEF